MVLNYSPVCFGIATVRCVTPVLSPRPGCESSVPSPSTINPLLLPRKGNISQNRTILLRVLLALGIKFPRKCCKTFGGFRKTSYLCSAFQKRALSSVGSERLPYKQRVGGSNPSAPTRGVPCNPSGLQGFFMPFRFLSRMQTANCGEVTDKTGRQVRPRPKSTRKRRA